jgi:general secretion pathway protein M
MSQPLLSWWKNRSVRERNMALVAALFAGIVLGWLLIVRPLGDALSDAHERHGAAIVSLAEARADVAALRAAEERAPVLGGALDALVSRSATDAGFPVKRLDSHRPNQVVLEIAAVRPQAFFAWVNELESIQGLIVERLVATPNTDQTLAVQITLRTRSG